MPGPAATPWRVGGKARRLRGARARGSPGVAGDSSLMYQCMALNVLSSFCSLQELWPELHAQTDFVRMGPLLLKTLEGAQGMHPAVDSALVCLACLSAEILKSQCPNLFYVLIRLFH